MRVFITGGTGFIGSHIVLELIARGDLVTILARAPGKVPSFQEDSRISVVMGDLEDPATYQNALEGHDAVVHAALCWDELDLSELDLKDARATVNLFHAAAAARVQHLIYTSSTAVHRTFSPSMTEQDRLTPDDFYGAAKVTGEAFLSAFSHQTDMRCNVIRPGPTVGTPPTDGVNLKCLNRLREIAISAARGEPIRVERGDGRQFVRPSDVAKLFAAVLHGNSNRETYLCVAREFTTWEQVAREAVAFAGTASPVIVEGAEKTRSLFDTAKIEREFGFKFSSAEGMSEVLRSLISMERHPPQGGS